MEIKDFIEQLQKNKLLNFFTGVPDSLLKPLNDYLFTHLGLDDSHIVAANEGNSVGLAAGYYMATGKIPVVYMQNSGIGNAVNPICSLLNEKVYAIPCFFIVGLRGEVGQKDEPQHVFQGEISKDLLECIGLTTFTLEKTTQLDQLDEFLQAARKQFALNKSVALLVKKGALKSQETADYSNAYELNREDVIAEIVNFASDDIIVSTTGKASRELFEIREKNKQDHSRDFLTVGSMGHSLSIAYAICKEKKKSRVWCIDGDGACLMHLGGMAVVGSKKPKNLVHILINNECHETVGGMPTASGLIDYQLIAKGCGYENIACVETLFDLRQTLANLEFGLTFIEIKCNIASRLDLGRPTTTAKENKEAFMRFLGGKE